MWTALETNLGIACACLPAMYPMLEAFTHFGLDDDGAKFSRRGSRRSSTKSKMHGEYSHQEKTARFSRPRRAPNTATSSFGFNQPVPVYDRSTICGVHEVSPVKTESPWRNDEGQWTRLSPPRGAIPHVSMMAIHRPQPVYMEEFDHRPETVDVGTGFSGSYHEYMKQGMKQGWV